MPVEVTYPGVYLEETPGGVHPIEGVSTSTAAIVGYTDPSKTRHYGKAVRVKTFAAYQSAFGGLSASGPATHVPWAVKQFFDNGGTQLYVVGLRASDQERRERARLPPRRRRRCRNASSRCSGPVRRSTSWHSISC